MAKCIFCAILEGVENAYFVYRRHGLAVILDKYPASKGHLLVIPEEHHEAVQDTPPKLLARAWVAASALAHIYRVRLGAPGVNVLTNSGRIAGQVIFHFHVHVIPLSLIHI
ncbi:MAG: HIT domain-containing protein, partial [Desulfurococcales archaeon]|nr:HIT domain-containing protein [Desulfurococcales archaeon]